MTQPPFATSSLSPSETEIKFEVPAAAWPALAEVMTDATDVLDLHAIYFDTLDTALGRSKAGLRLRRENQRWFQTLKAPGSSTLGRLEDEVELRVPPDGPRPDLDLDRHVFGQSRQVLRKALDLQEGTPWPKLSEKFETRVQRRIKTIHHGASLIEVALDEGDVLAAGHRRPIRELELELVRGTAADLLEAARQWRTRHGLWLNTISKAERGDLLVRGELHGPARNAKPPLLDGKGKPRRGEFNGAVLDACLDQIVTNASEIALGSQSDDHVHQLRVGIRRLRTALRELPDLASARESLEPVLVEVFRALGEHRDRTHVLQKMSRVIEAAGGTALQLPSNFRSGVEPIAVVQREFFQDALVALLEVAEHQRRSKGRGLRRQLRARLDKLHEQVAKGGKRFERLKPDQQHQVRKRLKRLRYLSEFAAPVFGQTAAERYLAQLKPAQDALGDYNDELMAQQLLGELPSDDAGAAFGIRLLEERREGRIKDCRKALKKLARNESFW
jgi:inorganic triphosphatase YgiF